MTTEEFEKLTNRLQRIEHMLQMLLEKPAKKEWYTTSEVAAILARAEFTVREWCRLKRIRAHKKVCGRGIASEWIISHEELDRVRNHGLLPVEIGSYR